MASWNRTLPRGLAPGELVAARAVFGDAIDWVRVRVFARPFVPMQTKRTAVTPWGAIHFRPEDHLPDFSISWDNMAWLIHELVHVWQHQTGQWVIPRGFWERNYQYGALDPLKPFERYGIEQQAAIVEDWYRLTQHRAAWRGSGRAADYRAVIPFLPS
ncbi:vgr related protein [Sphingomonas sp.]|uniref:vgr related protein n=1 Tax=Sphingomonas sp. TaxID=28214 RepID=UPI003CC5C5D3